MAFYKVDEYYTSRGLAAPGVIGDDRSCIACGYALRGLREGQRCPECGRPILAIRAEGLAEAQTAHLRRLARALLPGVLAWAGAMLLWFWVFYGLLGSVIVYVAAFTVVCALLSIFGVTAVWPQIHSPRHRAEHRLPAALRGVLLAAIALTGALLLVRTRWNSPIGPGALIALAAFVALAWLGLQTLACLLLRQVAIAGHDDALGDRFWNISWAIGLCAAFWAPFFALTQIIQTRSGFVPVCCMSGYLVAIGLLAAQLFFAHSLLQVRAMVRWSLRYREQFDDKTRRMMKRVEEGRQVGESGGTALARDVE